MTKDLEKDEGGERASEEIPKAAPASGEASTLPASSSVPRIVDETDEEAEEEGTRAVPSVLQSIPPEAYRSANEDLTPVSLPSRSTILRAAKEQGEDGAAPVTEEIGGGETRGPDTARVPRDASGKAMRNGASDAPEGAASAASAPRYGLMGVLVVAIVVAIYVLLRGR